MNQETEVFVLSGLPGMGKTQIAVNFADQYRDDYYVWIVNCRNERTKEADYQDIASRLNVPFSPEMSSDDIQSRVHARLSDSSDGPWILILDNVDKSVKPQDLPKKGGYVLITTNNTTTYPGGKQLKPVGPLEENEALELLQKITREKPSDSMRHLVNSLERFPLALNLAAHCITTGQHTISDYIKAYDLKKKPLAGKMSVDAYYEYTLENVWNVTFDHIKNSSTDAMEWLSICAFLNPDKIPKSLIEEWMKKRSEAWKSKSFEALDILKRYFVFTELDDRENYQIHGLLQKTVQQKLGDSKKEKFQMAFSFLKDMGKEVSGNEVNWSQVSKKLNRWWPIHFTHLFEESDCISQVPNEEKIQALQSLTLFSEILEGNMNHLSFFADQGLKIAQEMKNRKLETDFSKCLGIAYMDQNLDKAEKYFRDILTNSKEVSEENNSTIAIVKSHLSIVLLRKAHQTWNPELFDESGGYFEQSMNYFIEKITQDDTANQSWNPELFDESKDYFCKKETQDAICSIIHPMTIPLVITETEIPGLFDNAMDKDFIRFIITFQKYCLNIKDPFFKNEGSKIASIYYDIGSLYIALKQYKDAHDNLKNACKIQKKANQDSIPMGKYLSRLGSTFLSLSSLTQNKEEQKKFLDQAEKKLLNGIRILQSHLGNNHFDLAAQNYFLGQVYEKKGEFEKAQKFYELCYEIQKNHFGNLFHLKTEEILSSIERMKEKQHPSLCVII